MKTLIFLPAELTMHLRHLGGASHVFALVRGWRLLSSDLGFVVENALLGAIGLGLAVWAFRLTKVRRRPDERGTPAPVAAPWAEAFWKGWRAAPYRLQWQSAC